MSSILLPALAAAVLFPEVTSAHGHENTTCSFLYAQPPACDKSYADVTDGYDEFLIGYAILTSLVSLATFIATGRAIYTKKGIFPLDLRTKFLLLSCVTCSSLILRAPDPNGWARTLPIVYVQVLSAVGACSIYTQVILLCFDWIRVILRVSAKRGSIKNLQRLSTALIATICVEFVVFSGLQVGVDPSWLWQSIKFFIGAVILILIWALLVKHGWSIYSFLKANEKKMQETQQAGPVVVARGSMARSSSQQDDTQTRMRRSTTIGTMNRRNSKIKRIRNLMIITAIGIAFVAIAQLGFAASAVSEKHTLEDPAPEPSSFSDLLSDEIFDLAFLITPCVIMYFFREQKKDPDSTSGTASQGSRTSRSGTIGRSSTADRMKLETRNKRMASTTAENNTSSHSLQKGSEVSVTDTV